MIPLSQIALGSTASALVKVVAVREVSRSKTDSYFQSIQAADETAQILITIFKKDPSDFLPLKVNDIIFFQGKFAQSTIANKMQASVQPSQKCQVVDKGNSLSDELKCRFDRVVKVGTESKAGRKREFKALKDIKINEFFDFNGMMIDKSYGNMAQTCVMIDLVDFTINKELKVNKRSDILGLPLDEPCILCVTLWDENVNIVDEIPINSFVSLRNVRAKFGTGGLMEGNVHTDRRAFQKSVSVLPLNHPAVLEIKKRAEKAKITKIPTRIYLCLIIGLLNADDTFRLFSVAEILNSDNHLKAKIRIRILDHMPKQLDYFSRPVCSKCEEIFDPSHDSNVCKCGSCLTWQFLFCLLVADETGSIPLIVSDQEAIDFLSNLLPVNLLKDKNSLTTLKTLMSSIQDKPFDCFVESFKNPDTDIWRFKIFNTVIQNIRD